MYSTLRVIFLFSVMFLIGCSSGIKLKISKGDDGEIVDQENGINIVYRKLSPKVVAALNVVQPDTFKLHEDLIISKMEPYRLGIHDIVSVTVWEHPEITQPLGQYRTDDATGQQVGIDGMMYFPYIGKIPALGKTTDELRDDLTKRLSRIFQNPQIDVKVLVFKSKKFYLDGAIGKPGEYPLTASPLTLNEMFTLAGGVSEFSDVKNILLIRKGKKYHIDASKIFEGDFPVGKIIIQDQDKIYIPKLSNSFGRVTVVRQASGLTSFDLPNEKISLVDVLGKSNGVNELSDGRNIYILRKRNDTQINAFHLNGNNLIELALATQVHMQPNDIVYVASSPIQKWDRFLNVVSKISTTVGLINVGNNAYRTIDDVWPDEWKIKD